MPMVPRAIDRRAAADVLGHLERTRRSAKA
jgi:hypothetical protein